MLHGYVGSVSDRWSSLPELSRWFIRTALLYLLLALVLGLIGLGQGGAVVLWPTYVHLLVLGWLTQLIFGVAHWMFPRQRAGNFSGSDWLGWSTYFCLNAGLILRSLAESGVAPQGYWFVIAALLQLAAGWGFVIATWPRVRGR